MHARKARGMMMPHTYGGISPPPPPPPPADRLGEGDALDRDEEPGERDGDLDARVELGEARGDVGAAGEREGVRVGLAGERDGDRVGLAVGERDGDVDLVGDAELVGEAEGGGRPGVREGEALTIDADAEGTKEAEGVAGVEGCVVGGGSAEQSHVELMGTDVGRHSSMLPSCHRGTTKPSISARRGLRTHET
jgi:hypothetical protein